MPLAQMIYERFCARKQLKVEFVSMAYELKIFPYGSLRKPQIYSIISGGTQFNTKYPAYAYSCPGTAQHLGKSVSY